MMRFLELHLTAFGHFTDTRLIFPEPGTAGGAGFHLIHGANEAGKSTALAALSDLLFGFGKSSDFAFRHGYSTLSLATRIDNGAGQRLFFTRRKRSHHPVLDESGRPLDDAALKPFLGSLDRRLFEGLFGLGHERLRGGSKEMLAGGGEVGSSLFDAGAGIQGVRTILDDLHREADDLYRPKGQKKVLNRAKSDLTTAKKQLQEAKLSQSAWHTLDKERREREAELSTLAGELAENNRQRTRLERIRRTKPHLGQRAHLQRQLATLASVPELPAEAPRERLALVEALRLADAEIKRTREEIATLEESVTALNPPVDLLAQERSIEALNRECGAFHKSLADLPKRRGELDEIASRLRELWREGGFPGTPPADSGDLPPRPLLKRLHALLKSQHDLHLRRLQSQKNARELADEENRCRLEREALADTPDPEPLAARLREITERGPLERRLEETETACHRLEAEIDRERQTLPLWRGDSDTLIDLPVPSEEQVERFADTWKQVAQALKAARETVLEIRETLDTVNEDLTALTAAGEVPTAKAVQAARDHRDNGWSWIRRVYIDRETGAAETAGAFDRQRPLPEAFAASIGTADRLADDRLREAQRVARFETLENERKKQQKRLESALERQAELDRQRHQLEERWNRAWNGSGITPLEPAAMLRWPRKRLEIVHRLAALKDTRRQRDDLAAEIAVHHHTLATLLTGPEEPPTDRPRTLAALLQRGEALLQSNRQARSQRMELTRRLRETTAKHKNALHQEEILAREKIAWGSEWRQALSELEQPVESSPAAVESMLELLESVRVELRSLGEMRLRIQGMESDYADFSNRVTALLQTLDGDIAPDPPLAAVAALHSRLQSGKTVRQKREILTKNLEKQQEKLKTKHHEQHRLQQRLVLLETLYGCRDAEAMATIERQSAQRGDYRRELAEVEKKLVEQGDGHEITDLARAAAAEDDDTLPGRIDALVAENERLAAERSRVAAALEKSLGELARLQGGDAAARAAEDMEEAMTRLRHGAESHIVLHLAGTLLSHTIARHRERTQAPALGRAATLFQTLTDGAFQGIESDVDHKGGTILLAVRDTGERLPVEALSDGTRDQLFLALRLALVALHLAHNEPVPFVADDLLVHFDDQRSRAAFRVLSELSQKTQVLFFTHHAHLRDLAENTLGADRLSLLEL